VECLLGKNTLQPFYQSSLSNALSISKSFSKSIYNYLSHAIKHRLPRKESLEISKSIYEIAL
jgi:hypothetical protein